MLIYYGILSAAYWFLLLVVNVFVVGFFLFLYFLVPVGLMLLLSLFFRFVMS